jgi:DNA-binding transcriptional ArsR family regulator
MYNRRHATRVDALRSLQRHRERAGGTFSIAGGERSVSEIAAALELNQPSTSKHLQVRSSRPRRACRDGRNTLYRTNPYRCAPSTNGAGCSRGTGAQPQRIKAHAEEDR